MSLGRLKPWILLPMTTALGLVLVVVLIAIHRAGQQGIAVQAAERARLVQELLDQHLADETRSLTEALLLLQRDPALSRALAERDREALSRSAGPLFTRLAGELGVTHFYFLGPDRRVLLRLHSPAEHGDRIERFTLRQAERTQSVASGVELGVPGTLTLRVVAPWISAEGLTGYAELGKELPAIILELNRSLGDEFVVLVEKRHLDRAAWEAGLRRRGGEGAWDAFRNVVVLGHTFEGLPEALGRTLATEPPGGRPGGYALQAGERHYRGRSVPVADVQGRDVARILVLTDVSERLASLRAETMAAAVVSLIAGVALFVFFWIVAGRVEGRLLAYRNALEGARGELEERVRERTAQLEETQRIAGVGSWEFNAATGRAIWSGETRRILGVPSNAEACPATLMQAMHPDDRQRVAQCMRDALSGTQPYDIEYRIFHPDGAEHTVHARAKVEAGEGGTAGRLVGYVQDVTELRQAETALRQSEARSRLLLEHIPDQVLILSRDGVTLYVNHLVPGLEREQVIGRSSFDFVAPECRDRYAASIRQALNIGDFQELEVRDVSGRSFLVRVVPLDGQAEEGSVLALATDITERRQADDAVRESRRMLRLVLDNIPAGVFWKDRDGRYLGCNQLFAGDAGLKVPGEIIGKTDNDVAWREQAERYRADDREVMESGRPKLHYEEDQTAGDGSRRWLETSKIPLTDGEGKVIGVLGTYRDVTRRKRVEEALHYVVQGTSSVTGADFFDRLVYHLASALETRYAFIAALAGPGRDRLETISFWTGEGYGANFVCDLSDSPCRELVTSNEHLFVHADGGCQLFTGSAAGYALRAQAYVGAALFDSQHEKVGVLAVLHDEPLPDAELSRSIISVFAARAGAELERQGAQRALTEETERAQVTLHSIGDAVVTTDATGNVEYLNPVAEGLTGWVTEQARGQSARVVCHIVDEHTREAVEDPISRCLQRGGVASLPGSPVLLGRHGGEVAIESSAAPIRAGGRRPTGAVMVLRDVSEARRLNREISHQASHDPLTGLVNRREFERRLEEAVAGARKNQVHHALCYLDLDQFKVVNDTCGHVAGDELLRQLSGVLRHQVRDSDTLGRLGGDEFGVLLQNCPIDRARGIADNLRQVIREFRYVWQDRTFEVGVSVGVVAVTPVAQSISELLSQADVACYAAKDLGRNRVHVHEPEDDELRRRHRELHWAADLRKALEEDRFQLYCQPIVPVDGSRTQVEHHEVLVRLLDEDGSLVPPGAFIPAAERYNVMGDVDRWVIRNTFRRYAEHILAADRRRMVRLAINISGNSLNDDGLGAYIRAQLSEFAIPPELICFEVTETAAIGNLTQAAQLIREVKEAGSLFALDDFGSGLSSFAYLKNLPVDYLKIDGAFVRDMVRDPIDQTFVAAINQIGHAMGMETIAEWVENDRIMTQLRQLGVDYAQGYATGAPRAIEDLGRQPGFGSKSA
jgi:diguanylate cyclase (GGDEF)-like protein/PAS domain S-box-containing protein